MPKALAIAAATLFVLHMALHVLSPSTLAMHGLCALLAPVASRCMRGY